MRRPVTRSRAKALEQSRCNLCCREIIAMKPLVENNGKKSKARLRNVACTSLISKEVFDTGIMKKWNLDDSDMELDFMPPPQKKRKVKISKLSEQKKSVTVTESETRLIPHLPDEMWLKIFRMVLGPGQYPSMHRIQFVCRHWYRLSRHPSLWRRVDLSCTGTRWIPYRDSTLEWLSKHRLLSLLEINLHGWHCLTSEGLEHLAKHCPKLKTIELAFCSNISRDAIYTLTKYCTDLSRVNLANTTSDVVCVYPMVHLAKAAGEKLTSLDLSGNLLRGFNTVMNAICGSCPNLEELNVGRCRGDLLNMDVELWQHSLPHIKLFSLSYSTFQTVQVLQPMRPSCGWTKLQELSLAMSTSGGTKVPPPIDDALMMRFLSNSDSLQQLDVRGCRNVSADLLLKLSLPNIRILELGVFSDANQGGLAKLMHKYGAQLEEVNLSWTTYSQPAIQAAVQALVRTPTNSLRLLFLARTLITVEDLVEIVRRRPALTRIELKDCTNLPQEWRKLFNSDSKIKRLHKLVHTHMERKNKEGEMEEAADESKEEQKMT